SRGNGRTDWLVLLRDVRIGRLQLDLLLPAGTARFRPRDHRGSTEGRRMKAVLMGYYGAHNLGDEMMLFCLRRWLEAQGVSVSVLSENPRQVEYEHGLPAIRNWPLLGEWSWRGAWLGGGALDVLRAIGRRDALIVGGGDLVRDDFGWRGFFFPMEK